jgi:superfamily II DNA/RNA helicase
MSSQSFADLGVAEPLVRVLAKRQIDNPFAVQELVIPDVLAGHDVLAKSPTGSGKTLAFGLPMVQLLRKGAGPSAGLVLAPTRELALQIVEQLEPLAGAFGLQVVAVYGGAGIGAQINRAKRAHIVVATPGRLEDLIARGSIKLGRVQVLVLDEADRMLDMGFLPVVKRIVRQTPDSRQTLLFSATLDGAVGKLAAAFTRRPRSHEHKPLRDSHGKVLHRFVPVAHDDKLDTLVEELSSSDRGRTLVFVRTKRGADRLVKRLKARGSEAAAMHGDKSQAQREKALRRFHSGETDTLVATDVAARGIDVAAVTHVINFDAPADHETYIHRVGRTARAGSDGTGVTFVMPEQAEDIRRIASTLGLGRELEHAGLAAGPANIRGHEERQPGRRRRQRPAGRGAGGAR